MRVAISAPPRPIASPTIPIRSACIRTSDRTSAVCAPSAMRMPISRRRCATEYAITLNNPKPASASAIVANALTSSAVKRGVATERSMY